MSSIYPLPLDCHLGIFHPINFEEDSKHKDVLLKLKSLRKKLIYYNENIRSLASIGSYHVSFEWHYDKQEIEIYSKTSDSDPSHDLIFLRLRNEEVNRIMALLDQVKTYKDKVDKLFEIKGFNPDNTFAIYSNNSLDKFAINYEVPVISLWPINKEERAAYNGYVIKEFNKIAYSDNAFSNQYKCFDFKVQKYRLDNSLKNSADPRMLLEHIKKVIEKQFNYPKTLDNEIEDERKHIIKDMNIEIDKRSIRRNLFTKMVLYRNIDLNDVVLDIQEVNYYTHVTEVIKYYNYVIKALASQVMPKFLKPVESDANRGNDQIEEFYELFERTSDHAKIMALLCTHNYTQQNTGIWIDEKKGAKALLIKIMKDLKNKGYYKKHLTINNETYIRICKNSFRIDVKIDTAKRAVPDDHNTSFIPYATTLS